MSNVSFKRGDDTAIDNTPIVDGQLLFNTSDNKILMDYNDTRLQYGGDTVVDSTISTTSINPLQNKVVANNLNLKVDKSSVVDSLSNIISTTSDNIPAGCKGVAQLNTKVENYNSNLIAENNQNFKYGYQHGVYGYWVKEADTDVFRPFKSYYAFHNTITLTSPTSSTQYCVRQILNGEDVYGLDCVGISIAVWSLKTSTRKLVYLYNDDLISNPYNINIVNVSKNVITTENFDNYGYITTVGSITGYGLTWEVPKLVATQSGISETKPVVIDVNIIFKKV